MSDETPPGDLRQKVIEAIQDVYDPEIPVNIWELGLIYRVEVVEGAVEIDMTLTSPACPSAQELPLMVEVAAEQVEGIGSALVSVVWEPAWTPERMSELARVELGMF